MKNLDLHISAKILLFWYTFIFISTELLSYLHLLERKYIFSGELIFWGFLLSFLRREILQTLQNINLRSKSSIVIMALFFLTFVQVFFSAPSTTDSMVYHLPRIMYWMQEKTLFQDLIRNSHDYMAPFAEYILLHLYFIGDGDRLLFFSQWIAYIASVYIIGIIAYQLGVDQKTVQMIRLLVATLPIAVMQSSSTQIDLVVTVLVLLSIHLALIFNKSYSIKNSVLLGLSIGFGFLTKATYAFYVFIPILLILFPLQKNVKKLFILLITSFSLSLLVQLRFLSQNLLLYGNLLGLKIAESAKDGDYINTLITPSSFLSNLIRNIFVHLPIPIFSSNIQSIIVNMHNLFGLDINDPRITCCGTKFKVAPVLFPQEDIIGNPIHLLIILLGGAFIFYKRKQIKIEVKILYILIITSFAILSALIKWQPFHPRLEIPFFMIGVMVILIISSYFKKLRLFLNFSIFFSSLFAFLIIFLNVSKPYISYSLFYDSIKFLKPTLASIPQAFYIKPREQQYFNSRYYWYEPYLQIINLLKEENKEVVFSLEDSFEYPVWMFMKKYNLDYKVIPMSKISKDTIIISTTETLYSRKGYTTECVKTKVDYGYICLSKPSDTK